MTGLMLSAPAQAATRLVKAVESGLGEKPNSEGAGNLGGGKHMSDTGHAAFRGGCGTRTGNPQGAEVHPGRSHWADGRSRRNERRVADYAHATGRVEIENWLRSHLSDADGALQVVLLRRVKGSELLLNNFDQPLVVLAGYCQRVLDSDYLLEELVREADIEWGRVLGERPYFEKEGSPPDPDDPYTVESVRKTLSGLIEQLAVGQG